MLVACGQEAELGEESETSILIMLPTRMRKKKSKLPPLKLSLTST